MPLSPESVEGRLASRMELAIFTYNRAAFLRSTLEQLSTSPFRLCRITVQDNASTDGSELVCGEFQKLLPGLRVHRNRKNLGCSANYLKAVEVMEAEYTWVLCDDDTFDWSKIDDVVEKILEGKLDLISIGVNGHDLAPGTLTRTRELALTQKFFLWHSFIPALIFRTKYFDSNCLMEGYHNADTLLPHFAFNASLAIQNLTIYISKEKAITKSNNFGYAPIQFLWGWLRASNKIPDKELRKKALSEVFSGMHFWKTAIFAVLIETTFRKKEVRQEYSTFLAEARHRTPWILFKACLLLPLVLAPKSVHRACWTKYEAYRRKQSQEAPKFDGDR